MNREALAQVSRHLKGFLALFALLRQRHVEFTGRTELRLPDWHRICLYGEVLPRYLLLRAYEQADPRPPLARYFDHRLPVDAGIVFKTVRGLLRLTNTLRDEPHLVLARLPKQRRVELGLDQVKSRKPKRSSATGRKPIFDKGEARKAFDQAPFTTDDLLAITEAHALMVGDDEVCAAPTAMIRTTLDVLVAGDREAAAGFEDPQLASALADLAPLNAMCDALGLVYTALDRFRKEAAQTTERLAADLRSAPPGEQNARFDTHLDRYLLAEHRFLASILPQQTAVLTAAGCAETEPPLDLALIDDLVRDHPRRLAEQRGVRVEHLGSAIRIQSPWSEPREIG